jgi:hypothetical protein
MWRLASQGAEDFGQDPLNLVLSELADQSLLLSDGLQCVDRVEQLHFARPYGCDACHAAPTESNEKIVFTKKLSVRLLQDTSFRREILLAHQTPTTLFRDLKCCSHQAEPCPICSSRRRSFSVTAQPFFVSSAPALGALPDKSRQRHRPRLADWETPLFSGHYHYSL